MVGEFETGTEVTLELADGTKLEVTVNGNNFVSDEPVPDSVFEDNLSSVRITANGETRIYHNVKLVQNRQFGSEYMFVLAEKTPEEVERDELLQVVADIAELTLEVLDNGG